MGGIILSLPSDSGLSERSSDDHYLCLDGGEIENEMRCDGNVDCSHGDDEHNCPNATPYPGYQATSY